MVSKDLLPGIEYRENPRVLLIEYDNFAALNMDCLAQHKVLGFYFGCAWVPLDEDNPCIVRVMRGSKDVLAHEIQHCHGYADTYFPWRTRGIQ